MKKRTLISAFSILLLAGPAFAAGTKKTSNETVSISDSEFCGDVLMNRFSKRIKKLTNADHNKLIKNLQVSGCAERVGSEVVKKGCAPHLCGIEESIIAINTSANTISIGIVTNNDFIYYSENQNKPSEAIKKYRSEWN